MFIGRKGIGRRLKSKGKLTNNNLKILYSDLLKSSELDDEISISLDIIKRAVVDRNIIILDFTGKIVKKLGSMKGCIGQFVEDGIIIDVHSTRLTSMLSELCYVAEKRLFFARDSPLFQLKQNTIVFIKPSKVVMSYMRGYEKLNDYICYILNNPSCRCNVIIIDDDFSYDQNNLKTEDSYLSNKEKGREINAVE